MSAVTLSSSAMQGRTPPAPADCPQQLQGRLAKLAALADAAMVHVPAASAAGATVGCRFLGGARAGMARGASILLWGGPTAAAPAADISSPLGSVASALAGRRQACRQAADDLAGPQPSSFPAVGEMLGLHLAGAACAMAALPFQRADVAVQSASAAARQLLSCGSRGRCP